MQINYRKRPDNILILCWVWPCLLFTKCALFKELIKRHLRLTSVYFSMHFVLEMYCRKLTLICITRSALLHCTKCVLNYRELDLEHCLAFSLEWLDWLFGFRVPGKILSPLHLYTRFAPSIVINIIPRKALIALLLLVKPGTTVIVVDRRVHSKWSTFWKLKRLWFIFFAKEKNYCTLPVLKSSVTGFYRFPAWFDLSFSLRKVLRYLRTYVFGRDQTIFVVWNYSNHLNFIGLMTSKSYFTTIS